MSGLVIRAEPPPLREEPPGVIRVGDSRVLLELVIRAFQDGAPPETIVQRYPTVTLADAYSVIGYYFHHQADVQEYLDRREAIADELRGTIEGRQGDLSEIRLRLGARSVK